MKRILSGFLTCTLVILCIGMYTIAFPKEDGSPSGKTNSPGDGETCAQVDCHTGTAKPKSGLLSTNVSETGYKSSDTLIITVSIEFPGRSTFGFQASPQTLDGDKVGKIIVDDEVQTKTTGVSKYITHQKEGISGSDGKTWKFKWTPEDATGDVTFYYAVNAADGDGESTGDSIYYGSFTISEDPDNVFIQESKIEKVFQIQNPVTENILINTSDYNLHYEAQLFSVSGNSIISNIHKKGTSTLSVNNLPTGIYFLKLFDGKQFYVQRIVKV